METGTFTALDCEGRARGDWREIEYEVWGFIPWWAQSTDYGAITLRSLQELLGLAPDLTDGLQVSFHAVWVRRDPWTVTHRLFAVLNRRALATVGAFTAPEPEPEWDDDAL